MSTAIYSLIQHLLLSTPERTGTPRCQGPHGEQSKALCSLSSILQKTGAKGRWAGQERRLSGVGFPDRWARGFATEGEQLRGADMARQVQLQGGGAGRAQKLGNGATVWSRFCLADEALTSVQSLSRVQLFATPWTAAYQASLSITNSQRLTKLMSIESVIPSNQLILCSPHLLPPSIFPSIMIFSNESALCIRWPKYWSFSFRSVLPMNIQD